MLTLQKEKVLDVAEEIEHLLQLHYQEVALHKDEIPLDPDWPRYVAMEERGNCHVYTARLDGRLIGYSVFFTHQHIHYSGTMVANNDILFVHPEYRKGSSAGIKLIKFSEEQLKAMGVIKLTWHIKFKNDWSAVLYRRGYEDEDKIVGKIL